MLVRYNIEDKLRVNYQVVCAVYIIRPTQNSIGILFKLSFNKSRSSFQNEGFSCSVSVVTHALSGDNNVEPILIEFRPQLDV